MNLNHHSLSLKVVSASGLPAADSNGKSDPYVVLTVGQQKKQTSVKPKTLTPEWNEEFRFDIDDKYHVLHVQVFDHDKVSKDDPLGDVSINLKKEGLPIGTWHPVTRTLHHPTQSGDIKLELKVDRAS